TPVRRLRSMDRRGRPDPNPTGTMPTARVILNPTSNAGAAQRLEEQILVGLERRDIEAELVATTAAREGERLGLEAARARVDLVIAAGGDGTVHEVANGLLTALSQGIDGPVLGVLPIGTGNDFAKLIGPLGDLERSMDILVDGDVRRFDACVAEWGTRRHWFDNAAGTGIDVEVVRQIFRKRSKAENAVLKYLKAVLKSLVTYRAIPLRIRMDDVVIERNTMIIVAANGRSVGGGFWVAPEADPCDGLFDICVVNELSFFGALPVLARVLRGAHTTHRKVEMYQAEEVEIEALGPDPLFFQLDGELHEPPNARSLRLRLESAALPVMAGPEGV
ncbi:MAG: diacylglycerol kinase family lipid kinase, partial [Longimicrobiales bacterium]|nr:diacylglycerol kinase family lipid kinase [Longimicrobiales bacterium]